MNFKNLIKIVYVTPLAYLLLNAIPEFIKNPYSHPEFNLIFRNIKIHSLSVTLVCLQLLYTFWYFRQTKINDRITLPFIFLGLTLHTYEIVHFILYSIQTNNSILKTNLILHFAIITSLLIFLYYYYQKRIKVVKINKTFIAIFAVWIISMIVLFQIKFFTQLYLTQSPFEISPFREVWATGKLLSFLVFVVWFKKPILGNNNPDVS